MRTPTHPTLNEQTNASSIMWRLRAWGAALLAIVALSYATGCTTLVSSTRSDPISEDYSKRTPGAMVDDEFIETKAEVNLKKIDSRFKDAQIKVTSYNGVVLLTGIVPDNGLRDIATSTVQKIRKVRRVHNELYESPPRSVGDKLADYWLRQKIGTRLTFNRSIASSRYKVITHDGVVYFMGLATQADADAVVNATKDIVGVQKIVRVFEYIDSFGTSDF